MNDFNRRLEVGRVHEERVLRFLRNQGWTAEPFGQALLSEEMRSLLRHTTSPVRWLPDIIAGRIIDDYVVVIFVDAKAGESYLQTGNHCVETAAAESAQRFTEFAGCDVFLVFDDGGVLTPGEALEVGVRHSGQGARGSRTPFMLVKVAECRTVYDMFIPKGPDT